MRKVVVRKGVTGGDLLALLAIVGVIAIAGYFLFLANPGNEGSASTLNESNANSSREPGTNASNIIIDVAPHHLTVELSTANASTLAGTIISNQRMHYVLPSASNTPFQRQSRIRQPLAAIPQVTNVTLTANKTALQRMAEYNKQFLAQKPVEVSPPSIIKSLQNISIEALSAGDIAIVTVNKTVMNTTEVVTIDRITNPEVVFSLPAA